MARQGITFEQVAAVADALAGEGQQPTIRAVREKLGDTGSPNTIHKHLTAWREARPVAAAAAPAPAEPVKPAQAAPADDSKGSQAPEPSVVDPMHWWGALTSQFQQIAANALKDAAKQTSIDPTHNVATGLAKEAMKTATDMASQFAAKGIETMQAGQRAAAGAAKAPAAKKSAAKKAPAKSASKPAAKPAAKKATARRAPRKSAG